MTVFITGRPEELPFGVKASDKTFTVAKITVEVFLLPGRDETFYDADGK